ncbi:MAG: TrkH family potassium uptake protein [Rikenellaceae bacterium]
MRAHVIMRYIGMALLLNAVFMLISAGVSYVNDLDTGLYPLMLSFLLTATMGAFPMIFVSHANDLRIKESYVIVVTSWIASCLVGVLPFVLWGGEFSLINSWFESVSGYTTTGSTILTNVEGLPKGMLFWRSCTHVIGGTGVVLFTLAVVPAMGRAKVSLTNVEFSTLTKDNYTYKVQKALRILLVVYVFLITSEILALKLAGMDWFDSVNHAFSTIATGGFSTKNNSIAYFDNVWIEMVITFFMIAAGIHFGLLFASIQAKKNNIFSSEVSVYYFLTIIVCTALLTVNLWAENYYSFLESIRYSLFQAASLISTTGFATVDTNTWPAFSILILIFLSIQCACAGSTGGGIKSDRVLILFKTLKARFIQMQHPNAIVRPKLNNATLSEELISTVLVFTILYILLIFVGGLILTIFNIDLMTAFSASYSCISNVGPGFGDVSSMSNFNSFSPTAKFICTILMLLGRLELFGFIQIFLMKSWR